MTLTRPSGLVVLSLSLLAVLPAAGASAKTKAKRPTVKSVAPLTVAVGDQLTIKGKNFILGKKRNTVFFKAGSHPAVSVKTIASTHTTIKVVVPKTVQKYMTVANGVAQPTRFRLRLLARSLGKKYTSVSWSPMISPLVAETAPIGSLTPVTAGDPDPVVTPPPPPDCDGDGVADSVDSDDDNDLLSDTLETSLGLATCNKDTDGDGLEDGFEFQSALDLNNTGESIPLPYPGKRPYPNPLDPNDAGTDYDGDGLYGDQEHKMWKAFGGHTLNLNYSAGLKKSIPGPLTDDDRDVDGDNLTNWDEFNGPMQPSWWVAIYGEATPPLQPYDGLNPIDADSDGDGKRDDLDDIDHDLWTNAEELSRNVMVRGGRYRVHPFNPCLPDYNSPTCTRHPPINNPYPPFDTSPLPASPIVWPPTVTIATTASPGFPLGAGTLSDQATLGGGESPTGTVTFRLYGPGDTTCTGPAVFTSTATLNGMSAASTAFTPTLAGTYSWVATYNGDGSNNPVSGTCGEATETSTVAPSGP